MKGCRKARRWIYRDVDQSLSLDERFLLDEHLVVCRECEAFHEQALGLEEALVRMPEPPEEGLDVEAAVASIRRDIDSSSTESGRVTIRRWRQVAAAAGFLAVLFAGWLWAVSRSGVAAGEESESAAAEAAVEPEPELDGEAVLSVVRTNLLAARGNDWDAVQGDASELVARFEEGSQEILLWPLARLAEKLLADPDPEVASVAARYLGQRGDRISAFRLEGTLGRDDVAGAAVRALGDLGERGVSVLARALRDPRRSAVVLVELKRIGGPEAAAAIERTLLDRPSFHAEPEPLLDALAATGPAAVEPLLRLAGKAELAQVRPLEWLRAIDGGEQELVRVVNTPGRREPVALLLEALAVVQPEDGLPWVEERVQELRHREAALYSLVTWDGTAPVASLLRLDSEGRLPDNDLLWALSQLGKRDVQRMTEYARELLLAEDAITAGRYLELLLVSGDANVAPALGPFVHAELLSDDERQLAALAIGEIGREEDALRLRRGLERLGPEDKRLYAACLITVYRVLGEPAVAEVVAGFPSGTSRQVLTALDDLDQGDAGAIGLSRVARALDGAFPKNSRSRNPIL